MRHFLPLIILLCCSQLNAQDTIYGESKTIDTLRFSSESMSLIEYSAGCAHGHECCSSGCRCCPQLNREQHYDTIFYSSKNDIQRIAVVERYFFAKSNDLLPVHHRFRKKGGEWSKKYYRADLNAEGSSNWGDGWSRYPKEDEKHYQKTNRALVVDETGDYSMIDLEGNQLEIPFATNTLLGNGVYLSSLMINDQHVFGFSDGQGHKIGPLQYSVIRPFNESGIAIAQVNRRFIGWHSIYEAIPGGSGLVNCSGEVVLRCVYSDITEIGPDRYAVVCENGRTNIINAAGKEISKEDYRQVNRYSEGLVFAKKNDSLTVVIDLEGNEVFSCDYEWSYGFKDGLAAVLSNRKWGFIDRTGKLVIPMQFDQVKSFCNGVAPVAVGTDSYRDEWKLIDKTGKYITRKVYDEISEFKNGLARAFINGVGTTLIDTEGNELFPCTYILDGYGTETSWYIDGMLIRRMSRKEESLEIINERGQQILDLGEYVAAEFIRDGSYQPQYRYYPFLLAYKQDRTATLLDFDGNSLVKGVYTYIGVFSDSIAVGYRGDEVDIIDLKTGESYLTYPKNDFYTIDRGIMKLKAPENPYGYNYYNLKGEKLTFD